jgi:type IV secretion system protein TrbG
MKRVLFSIWLATSCFGQANTSNPATPNQVAARAPNSATTNSAQNANGANAGGSASPAPGSPAPSATTRRSRRKEPEDLPLQLSKEAPLPENARRALALSQAIINADPKATMGSDGRVILTYGTGIPTIVCALLQVTELDLAPGESIVKDGIDRGDSTEFSVASRHAGSGATAYEYLVIKPLVQNIETTMTVATNRRVYYLRLRSTESEYMARIAFSYPEEEAKAKQELASALARAQEAAATSSQVSQGKHLELPAPPPPLTKWKYSLKKTGRDADYIVPLFVGDDGAHTHIELPQEARTRGLPVLQIRDATGPIPANSHWDNTTLIVDALFEDGCLLEGVGRKQQRVCIHNQEIGKGKKHANQ